MVDLASMKIDPRIPVEMLNRSECRKILEDNNITYDPGITKKEAIKLIEAHQLDINKSITWERIVVGDEVNGFTEKYVPKRIIPKSLDPRYQDLRDQKMAQVLEEAVEKDKTESSKKLEDKIDNLTSAVSKLIELQMEQMKSGMQVTEVKVSRETTKETDPHKMKFMAFKKWAKERGYEVKKGENRKEIIDYLSVQDVVEKTHATGKIDEQDPT